MTAAGDTFAKSPPMTAVVIPHDVSAFEAALGDADAGRWGCQCSWSETRFASRSLGSAVASQFWCRTFISFIHDQFPEHGESYQGIDLD